MQYRDFGRTGIKVSAVGFGAWPIGGEAYGVVDGKDALRALAVAEELGCNLIDTASVYGVSQEILGEFLQGRRQKWILASKYSGQKEGLLATLQKQLSILKTDYIDFYQLHWVPLRHQRHLYDELYAVKKSGLVRFIGVSLKNSQDIKYVVNHTELDGFQMTMSLLDPAVFSESISLIQREKPAVLVKSSLKQGFLTGKYDGDFRFTDPCDQRSKMSEQSVQKILRQVEAFRFLENDREPLMLSAARYPLAFPEISSVLMGCKNYQQAKMNFGQVLDRTLSNVELAEIKKQQQNLKLFPNVFVRTARNIKASLRG